MNLGANQNIEDVSRMSWNVSGSARDTGYLKAENASAITIRPMEMKTFIIKLEEVKPQPKPDSSGIATSSLIVVLIGVLGNILMK